MLKNWKLHQVLLYSLAIIVNNIQTPEIQAVLSSFFVTVMILQMVVIGVVEGVLNIGVQNGIQRQLKARGPVWGPTGPSLNSQHSKLNWPTLHSLSSPQSTNAREPWPSNDAKVPLEAYRGSNKSCHRNQTCDFGARYTVEYDSVLSQQSISDEIISLILCVWKLGFSNPVTYAFLFVTKNWIFCHRR